jgi:hypothetical protein
MSGGFFDYEQFHIGEIADKLARVIEEEENAAHAGDPGRGLSHSTLLDFRDALELLQKAAVYVNRIDWLLSGDDGEVEFDRRLFDDLRNLEVRNED